MKGLQTDDGAGAVYLHIKHKSICEESKTQKPGFEEIKVTNPRTKEEITKYIKRYKSVEALICKIEWYDREHDGTTYKGWKLSLDANGVPCILDLPFQSTACKRFMKLAENLDFSQPVEFRAWHDTKEDKLAFLVGQNDENIAQAYTRDNPGDCPAPVQSPVTKKWNFDKQDEYLHAVMTNVIIPAVEAIGNPMPMLEMAHTATATASHAPDDDLADDDIPF